MRGERRIALGAFAVLLAAAGATWWATREPRAEPDERPAPGASSAEAPEVDEPPASRAAEPAESAASAAAAPAASSGAPAGVSPAASPVASPAAAPGASDSAPPAAPERATLARAPPGFEQAPLEVLVQEPGGAPVPGAFLVLFRGEDLLGSGATDALGVARFAAPGGSGEYALFASGWQATRGALDLAVGRRTLALVDAATIGGRVLLDGEPPEEPLEFLWSSDSHAQGVFDELPHSARAPVQQGVGRVLELSARSRSDGTFAFRGLAADERGLLLWEAPLQVAGIDPRRPNARSLLLTEPSDHLELRLTRAHVVQLRVVDPKGKPFKSAHAVLAVRRGAEYVDIPEPMVADAHGRMTQLFGADELGPLRATVGRNSSATPRVYEFEPPEQTGGVWDLGDLAVPPTWPVTVLVQDADGAPIAGAWVTAWIQRSKGDSKPTDPTGRTVVDLDAAGGKLRVQAFGCESAFVPVEANADEATVTLSRACVLAFTAPVEFEDKRGLVLELEAGSPLLAGERGAAPLTPWTPGGPATLVQGNGTTRLRLDGDTSSDWRVGGLAPGKELRARVLAHGREVCGVDIAPLSPTEQRVVELPIAARRRELAVVTTGPDGEPCRARVTLVVEDGARSPAQATTDRRGKAALPVFDDRCAVYVWAPGCASRWVDLDPIPEGLVAIALEAGRSVEIELVREDGSPYGAPARVARGDSALENDEANLTDAGTYVLGSLPAQVVLLTAFCEGRKYSLLHDATVPSARLVVAAQGEIHVEVRGTAASGAGEWCIGLAERGAERDVTRVRPSRSEAPGTLVALLHVGKGSYDVWLERAVPGARNTFARVGRAAPVDVDLVHWNARVELEFP